jgi:hypothetical protein
MSDRRNKYGPSSAANPGSTEGAGNSMCLSPQLDASGARNVMIATGSARYAGFNSPVNEIAGS